MLGSFVYVFLILAVKVSWGVISYGAEEGIGVKDNIQISPNCV